MHFLKVANFQKMHHLHYEHSGKDYIVSAAYSSRITDLLATRAAVLLIAASDSCTDVHHQIRLLSTQ